MFWEELIHLKLLNILSEYQKRVPEMKIFYSCWCSVLVTSIRGCYIIKYASFPFHKGGVFEWLPDSSTSTSSWIDLVSQLSLIVPSTFRLAVSAESWHFYVAVLHFTQQWLCFSQQMAEPGRTVRVSGLPTDTEDARLKDKLFIHFLRDRNGGGEIDSVTIVKATPAYALITFEDSGGQWGQDVCMWSR